MELRVHAKTSTLNRGIVMGKARVQRVWVGAGVAKSRRIWISCGLLSPAINRDEGCDGYSWCIH